jgi:hypothetical protein
MTESPPPRLAAPRERCYSRKMTLNELASGLGLDTQVASDHLWQLGMVAESDTDLTGALLKSAREYLAALAAHGRPAPPPIDARDKEQLDNESQDDLSNTAPTPVQAVVQLNIAPPTGSHRLYELSKQTGVPTESLITAAHRIGIKADHVTQLTEGEIKALWVVLSEDPPEGLIEKRVDSGIKRRRRIKNR